MLQLPCFLGESFDDGLFIGVRGLPFSIHLSNMDLCLSVVFICPASWLTAVHACVQLSSDVVH